MAIFVKDTPEEARFPAVNPDETRRCDAVRASVWRVFMTIVSNPVIWIIASAYACTGAVRQGIDQWFPRFMQEVHHVNYRIGAVSVARLPHPVCRLGRLADFRLRFRHSCSKAAARRLQPGFIFRNARSFSPRRKFHSANAAVVFLVLISFTANATHSILGTAAAMDVGGAKMAGFASGLIDSFQYFGGSLAGYFLGLLLDKSWGYYFYFMAPFGIIGGCLMLTILGRVNLQKK